jgi:hypothetical protein
LVTATDKLTESTARALAAANRRPRRSRLVLAVILGLPAVLFGLAALRAVSLAREGPVPDAMRDLNCDGKVSTIEWLRAGLDYDIKDAGQGCTAVYHVKTGRAVAYQCKTEPKCRTARQWQPK